MKLVGISGSIRENSYNTQLLKTIKNRFESSFELDILQIKDLPPFNQDEELNPPESVKTFKKVIKEADGVILATPEYNWSVPGVLKNAIDWTSRVDKVLENKLVMIVGASTGAMGTIRAQIDLRRILSSPGTSARVLPPNKNEFLLNFAGKKFDEEGKLTDLPTLEFLDKTVSSFLEFI